MADQSEHSKDLTVAEAANVIAGLPDYDAVLAFVGDDERKGVVEAADRRGADLAGPAPTPATSSDALRLGLPAGPESKPGKPLGETGQGKVTVRTAWPIDSFEHGLDKVPVVTSAGVEVNRADAAKLNELAAKSGITLEEVEL